MADDTATPVADGQAQAAVPAGGDTQAAAVSPPSGQTDAAQDQTVDSAAHEELQPTDDEKDNWNKLDPETRKIVNRAYTKARMRDSAKLKEHPGQQIIDRFNSDPVGTFKAIEAQLKATGALKDGDTPQPQAPSLSQQTEQLLTQAGEHFGPEGAQLLRQLLQAELQKEIAPLRQGLLQTEQDRAKTTAEAVRTAFEAKHPGSLPKYEKQMAQTALRLTQGGRIPAGVEPVEWLEMLHTIVAQDDIVSAKAAEVVARMQQSATVDKSGNAVPSSRVAKKAPSLDDFGGDFEKAGRAAGEAALRGDAWE